jgi:hypothetical protein
LTRWVATPASGDSLRFYLITSSESATAAATDGGITFGDADIADEYPYYVDCKFIGAVFYAGNMQTCSSGTIEIYSRYVAIMGFNGSATKALTNTAGDHIFTFTEAPEDIQAAS